MPFPIYLPFYPGHEPNLIFSREASFADYEEYLALGDRMTSAAVFEDEVPRDGMVLDAGCGWGRWLIRLHRRGRRTIGLDLHQPVLEQIRAFVPEVPLLSGAVDRLPLRDATLAAIISLGVVEHAEAGPGAALREFARVLRPGGRLLVSVPYNNLLRRLIFNPLFRHYNTRWAGRGYYFVEYRFGRRELVAEIERAGLRVLSCHPHDFLPPLSMSLVADRSVLATRFVQKGESLELDLPDFSGWHTRGWPALSMRALRRVSPWLGSAEILVVAEKPAKTAIGCRLSAVDF